LTPVVLAAIAVAVWYPPWRWYALGWAVPLGLVLLFSAAIWIRKRRHTEADEMDETRELLEDLRDGAAWLFKLWP
jgi:cytochrome c-type biogenesis protein CcmH/NrfF